MSLDLEQPAPELDSAAASAANPETGDFPTDSSEVSTDTDLTPEQQAAADEIEEELEGIKLRGTKEALEKLKSERLMQADYTRKTQEVADHRRNLEAQQTAFQQAAQFQHAHLREVAQMTAVDDRLAQFQQVNWQQLTDNDPVQALKLHTEFTQLQAHRSQLANSLTQKQQYLHQEQQRATAKQLSEAGAVLERDIKGWSPELANKLSEYGKSIGYPPEVLASVTQPAFVKTLHKAYQYDQLMKQRASKPAAQPSEPVTRVGGGSAAVTKPLSDTSIEEFARRRREYISKHR